MSTRSPPSPAAKRLPERAQCVCDTHSALAASKDGTMKVVVVTRHAFTCSFYVRPRFLYEPTADRWLWFMVCYIHVAIFFLNEIPFFFWFLSFLRFFFLVAMMASCMAWMT